MEAPARRRACRGHSALLSGGLPGRGKARTQGREVLHRGRSKPAPSSPQGKRTRFCIRSTNSGFNPANYGINYAINKAAEVVDGALKSKKRTSYNGTFALVLANLVVFAAGQLKFNIQPLMLYHMKPQWYQFLTSIFCHATWQHLSSNLFFLYIFGKLVEEEEGVVGVVTTYLVCGIGGAIASLLLSSKHAISLGASGAVFGLFAVSVLVKLSFNPKKLIESAILGQFVYQQVANEVKMQAGRFGTKQVMAGGSQVSHVAHLAGALAGVILILLISRLPAAPSRS
ncbi:rhomboid peptidase [Chloropicon primus]|uniref:Rhomboid peptidase n=1 Tax=Chloropicon primus TaxID=1764295 RepID=A0A5B8MU91_9CHLO|nr:rhomboid peptidase [Chloropicon primus]UPR02229.1 rhomboid peptidase [Chloropicon primus]|eukprot:QDZ23012.1 rhomboid peptidase [Chloropicon primus]